MRRTPATALLILLAAVVSPGVDAQPEAPTYLCYGAKAAPGAPFLRAFAVAVSDRLTSRSVDLVRPAAVCRPTSDAVLLAGYAAHPRKRPRTKRPGTIEMRNRFGRVRLALKSVGRLLLPSAPPGGEEPPTGASLVCYGARAKGRVRGVRLAVRDALGERLFDLGRPARACLGMPGADELLCYRARLARTPPLRQPASPMQDLTLENGLGTTVLRAREVAEVCVPSLRPPGPPSPPPPFALQVTPRALTVMIGEKPAFAATARYGDGSEVDVTGAVSWQSSDESVVTTSSSVGGVFVDPVGVGTATISVVDPATGISSSASGGDATLTVTWSLESLTLSPHAVTKRPGDHEGYTVIGHFAGSVTKNLTQRVFYVSSKPSVARAANLPGNRSRVEALQAGTTTISARDPISGITTTDSGNDATLRVTAALQFIVLSSNLRYSSRFPGESQRFTAQGHYADGSRRNFTQRCTWTSSDPAVAVATNPEDDRSRIDAIAPGVTMIGCIDPVTGIQAAGHPFWVLGGLTAITAYGAEGPKDWLRLGSSVSLTAVGLYEGGGQRSVTQDVVWATRDPDVALATNAPGNRSQVVAVGAGNARIFATDLASGIVSNDALVLSLGKLIGLAIKGTYPSTVITLDGVPRLFAVRGLFEAGSLNLTLVGGYTLESSDPTILEVVNGRYVRPVAVGTATLTARDDDTGVASPPVTVTVKGGLASITLTPPSATRGIGEWESFTATGNYPPDVTANLTQRLVYSTSDTAVAVADNVPGQRSRIRTVGAGTATVTATDPFTGIAATAGITVLPGTIERVTIEPSSVVRNLDNDFSFTAIGHYPDGSTINVTQVVTWDSLVPDVAEATNEAGNRSRVVAKAEGTAPISARHPSGVSSHDTGDDGTFVAKPLASITLTPSLYAGPAGTVRRYTLVGAFADASTINLTQDAFYWTDDAAVAEADNEEGDRSAVRLVGPGQTMVHGAFADWNGPFPQVLGSAAGAFLTVVP